MSHREIELTSMDSKKHYVKLEEIDSIHVLHDNSVASLLIVTLTGDDLYVTENLERFIEKCEDSYQPVERFTI